MKLGIIGCGLIGAKRAAAGFPVAAAADRDRGLAEALCRRHGGRPSDDLRDVLASDAEAVCVAVPHHLLAPIALEVLQAGKHVLLEKPGARTAAELAAVAAEADKRGLKVKVGYNHRWHPAFLKARELVDQDFLGPVLYVRGRYGHGGRPGYETEWRFDPAVSGGGELLDQGSHLLDLARWFLGDLTPVSGLLPTYFWPGRVEDNCFLTLASARGACAFLHASWTEWRNLFSFEICGVKGKLAVDGLGGSYGVEQLSCWRMLPQMGPPETIIHQYPFGDDSWRLEIEELAAAVREDRQPQGGVSEAVEVLRLIDGFYARASAEAKARFAAKAEARPAADAGRRPAEEDGS
jgi:predicted dehydrogenase